MTLLTFGCPSNNTTLDHLESAVKVPFWSSCPATVLKDDVGSLDQKFAVEHLHCLDEGDSDADREIVHFLDYSSMTKQLRPWLL